MRKAFAELLYKHMQVNKDIWLVVGDLGFGIFDKIRDDFPDRFLNTGAAEVAMMDIAIGLALEGKIPFVYTISSFYWRCAEAIRLYVDHEIISVNLIGSGINDEYKHDGFSHSARDIPKLFNLFTNIKQHYPVERNELKNVIIEAINSKKPNLINLHR